MEKILIDSDVCLDSITGRIPHSNPADRLFGHVEDGVVKGIVSAESFSNIFYILRKLSSAKMAIQQIKNLRLLVNAGAIHESTIDSALKSGWNDFEDSLQYFCSLENDCDAIVTRNSSDFQRSEIPVLTPTEFIDTYLT